jgi:excisionase family DNA binding protein
VPIRSNYVDEERHFLTIPEVAQLLRINRGRAYAMANDGTLPGVIRIGRSIRVDRVQLIAGFRENQQGPMFEVFRNGD